MRSRTTRHVLVALMLAASTFAGSAQAADPPVPQTITNQGRLFDVDNNPIDGSLTVVFSIYDTANATAALRPAPHTIAAEQGFYSVTLGAQTPFGDDTFDGSVRFFGIKVGTEPELLPRAPIQSVPYALFAGDVTGDIHPHTVSIGDFEVIDQNGQRGSASRSRPGPLVRKVRVARPA